MEIKQISRIDCKYYIEELHYAHRWPSISFAYGLFNDNKLIGICTYGTPASSTLRRGIAGDKYIADVLELNRLCLLNNGKNEASQLVGNSLRLLPKNKIIVSFADNAQDHIGYVYQATNFMYTGLSAKRTDWCLHSRPELHGQTVADEFRGQPNRAALMRNKYGEDFYLKPRSRKHRYIYITGDKNYKKAVLMDLKYSVLNYPKKSSSCEPCS